jgi:hypothetical protein
MGDQPLTHGERDTLERLVACGRVRRFQGTGPLSRAENLVHVYYTPEPATAASQFVR